MSGRAKRFDDLYAADPDPWSFRTSGYERAKYAATLRALPRQRYRSALEIGCSIGVLTERLATRCDHVLGIDVSRVALETARQSVRDDHVEFRYGDIPASWPAGDHDLIVFSEVLYFLSKSEIETCAREAFRCLDPDGDIILVDWLGKNDCAISGELAADTFCAAVLETGAVIHDERRDPLYRIDVISARRTFTP